MVGLQLRADLFFVLSPFFCVCFLGCFVYSLCTKLVSLVIYAVLIYKKNIVI